MRIMTRGAVLLAMGAALVVPTLPAGAEEDDKVLRGPKARSERGDRGGRFSHGRRVNAMRSLLRSLDLSDDQKDEIKDIRKANREEMKAWHTEHKDEIQEINKKIKELHDQKRKLMEASPAHQDLPSKIRGVLDEGQQKTFDEQIEKIKQQHKKMRQSGRRGKNREGRDKSGYEDKDSGGGKDMLDL